MFSLIFDPDFGQLAYLGMNKRNPDALNFWIYSQTMKRRENICYAPMNASFSSIMVSWKFPWRLVMCSSNLPTIEMHLYCELALVSTKIWKTGNSLRIAIVVRTHEFHCEGDQLRILWSPSGSNHSSFSFDQCGVRLWLNGRSSTLCAEGPKFSLSHLQLKGGQSIVLSK